jgi:hypothetical protein
MIVKFLFEEGDIVKLPLNQLGIIKKIQNIPWGFKYQVEIIRNTLFEKGAIEDFKYDQLRPIFDPLTYYIDEQNILSAKINYE